jgi:hypothetical protein
MCFFGAKMPKFRENAASEPNIIQTCGVNESFNIRLAKPSFGLQASIFEFFWAKSAKNGLKMALRCSEPAFTISDLFRGFDDEFVENWSRLQLARGRN